jgi:ATP phosphoribosyltransferase
MTRRLRLAIPNKGRLVEPTLRLLHDAGLVFEEHDRSLVALVQNYELDILFVRTNDIIEFVGDGVADLGITGVDLLSETGAELPQIRSLGYGRCRLAAASASPPLTPTRRGVSSRVAPSPSRSSPSRAPSRSRHGLVWPRGSSTSSRPARPW